MNKALVIYDNTGKIWSIVYGADEAPQGLQSMWVDIPNNAILDKIDIETGEPVFSYLPETDLGQLQQEMRDLSKKVDDTTTKAEDIMSKYEEGQDDLKTAKLAASFAAVSFTDEQAVQVKELYPHWEDCVGGPLKTGDRVLYDGLLYKVRQDIESVQTGQYPSVDTAALYEEIVYNHAGTMDDPIPYNNNMELFNGKYYSQDGVTYYCFRDSGQAVYNPLKDLVSLYVNIASATTEETE